MEKNNLKIKSTVEVEKLSFNDWMNMFKVSSQYKESIIVPRRYFDMDRFKQNIKTGRILNNED